TTPLPPPLSPPLSLHDALPICWSPRARRHRRAVAGGRPADDLPCPRLVRVEVEPIEVEEADMGVLVLVIGRVTGVIDDLDRSIRSEEHTSELQSPYDLVCRLLL